MPEFDAAISYAPRDGEIVRSIAKRLRNAGVRVWFDKWDLLPGMSSASSTLKALENTKVVLLLIGKKGYSREERSWVSYESSVAPAYHLRSRRINTLPVLLPGASPSNIPSGELAYLTLEDSTDESLTRLVSLLCLQLIPLSVEIAGNVTPAGFQPWARSWRTSPLLKDRNSWTKPILE